MILSPVPPVHPSSKKKGMSMIEWVRKELRICSKVVAETTHVSSEMISP
jgi:hypothetical protein